MLALAPKLAAQRQPRVAGLAVALLETLLKNGGHALHEAASDPGLQAALRGLCEGRAGGDVQVRRGESRVCVAHSAPPPRHPFPST